MNLKQKKKIWSESKVYPKDHPWHELSEPNPPVQEYEKDPFNSYQNFLYKRLLYGITIYDPAQVRSMNKDQKSKIIADHKKCQYLLNIWKQELVNESTNRIFDVLFPHTALGKLFTERHRNSTDGDFICVFSFKDLKITKVQIVERMIRSGLLPKDFHTLTKPKHESAIPSKRNSNPDTKL